MVEIPYSALEHGKYAEFKVVFWIYRGGPHFKSERLLVIQGPASVGCPSLVRQASRSDWRTIRS